MSLFMYMFASLTESHSMAIGNLFIHMCTVRLPARVFFLFFKPGDEGCPWGNRAPSGDLRMLYIPHQCSLSLLWLKDEVEVLERCSETITSRPTHRKLNKKRHGFGPRASTGRLHSCLPDAVSHHISEGYLGCMPWLPPHQYKI